MEFFIVIAVIILIGMSAKNAGPKTETAPTEAAVASAIGVYIVAALDLPQEAVNILVAHSDLETGHWASHAFIFTRSLFNRHKGNGTLDVPNSDGQWTGKVFYAGPGDTDLRIYTDVNQSAMDMAQLLSESLYAPALNALRQGDPASYYAALGSAGFAASNSYASDLLNLYSRSYA